MTTVAFRGELGARPGSPPLSASMKTALFLETPNTPGSLVREALAEAGKHASRLRVLGSFPRAAAAP